MIEKIKHWIKCITTYDTLLNDFDELMITNSVNMEHVVDLQDEIELLHADINKTKLTEELEEFWNNKRKKELRTWVARDGVRIDLRCFFQTDDTLPKFTGKFDDIVQKAHSYVANNIKYTPDNGEFWQYAYETALSRTGDCEDGAILMANIMMNCGVPYWRIRLNKGKVQGGYHAWLNYFRESDSEWYCLDWCYWKNESLGFKKKWKDAEKYFTCDCSWNSKYSFGGLNK
jgi:hypothetical protein